jgi:hypothetical protein
MHNFLTRSYDRVKKTGTATHSLPSSRRVAAIPIDCQKETGGLIRKHQLASQFALGYEILVKLGD